MLAKNPTGRPPVTRRHFLQRSAATVGALTLPAIIPSSTLARDGAAAPSERVVLGCIGLGIQGMGNMRTFRGNREVQVVAVCDVHENQRSQGKHSNDEFYGNKDCAAYRDFRELMARKDIDAVQITAPDHWHPLMALEAVRQGKHMYCEKPIGWSVRAAQALRKAVKESKVVFQFGTQQRSGGNFRRACELVRNGKIGQLKTILVGVPGSWTCLKQPTEPVPKELDYDLWLGPAPMAPYCYQRCRPYVAGQGWSIWYCISDYCMGMIGNWGVHHLDIAQWGNGTDLGGPTEVEGTGVFPKDMLTDCATHWQVENRYANGVTLVHMDDVTARKHPLQQEGHGHGVMWLGTEGWVHVDRSRMDAKDKSLLKAKPGPNEIQLFKSDNHHGNFIDAVRGRTQPAAPIDIAVCSDILCNLQEIAIRLKRKLRWDPAGEKFVNDEEANRMLDRPMRGPWKL
ncbi:MAG TPA: Gfo/Idh/MocA family oxidoreductase [Planctomycetota bacterium]|nr:Gfo/Idh/MocA family oxidoreductase [Planctomycetota bacterium]